MNGLAESVILLGAGALAGLVGTAGGITSFVSYPARWLPVAAVGGAAGAALLLWTTSGVFVRVVPFLVAAGSLTLLAQPKLAARRLRRRTGSDGPLLPTGVVAVSLYNGYFGAGSGVMAFALML